MAEPTNSPAGGGLGTGRDEVQLRFREDDLPPNAQVTVDAFLEQDDATAVRVEPGDDARDLLPHLGRIRLVEVNFPVFGDGRGYSAARLLREEGYTGELRAVGDVLVDQIAYMRRCGFDSFAPERPLDEADVKAAFDRFPHAYQAAADNAVPIWKLRHG
ncbi:DUF934 domain-containing protein [Paraurantiacibacter namhicola]|uniref:Oxidoreductase n=1 Tax=Paraurantiacibacter namhicola TaxID=645517 RepID=A0A1C7DAT1_9SPHN|nr:DUF934 domain-containing protein [Paraurantiacibacter namhicola]ANU08527.1 hypothetical protein A6F65_02244 [Paraurantiacibacter namhicola]